MNLFEITDTTTKEDLVKQKDELINKGESLELIDFEFEKSLQKINIDKKYGVAIKNHKKMNINTYILTCESGEDCLLREPTVQESNSVFPIMYGIGREADFNEAGKILISKCWIAGDSQIRKDDNLLSEVAMAFIQLSNIKRADVKKN